MHQLPILALTLQLLLSAPAPGTTSPVPPPDPVEGIVVGLVPAGDPGPRRVLPVVRAASAGGGAEGPLLILDDPVAVSLLERVHSVLLSDHTSETIRAEEIGLRLVGIEVEASTFDDRPAWRVVEVEELNPDWPRSEQALRPDRIAPPCPEPDEHHRYLTVPVSREHPEWGTFELYYELSSDFDPERPTVLVPTDGQRSFSVVGWADRYREMFDLPFNVVTPDFRGMPCSPIPGLQGPERDWARAYEVLRSDNAVEDLESVRRALPVDGPVHLLGGSGTAMIGLAYLARHPEHVDRAFLMSFFKDATTSSVSGTRAFREFLTEHRLEEEMERVRRERPVPLDQLLFLIQRLLYFDRDEARALIDEVAAGGRDRYDRLTERLGTVDFFVRSVLRDRPWTAVFMYETNVPTPAAGELDVNRPFLDMGAPLAELAERGLVPQERFDVVGLGEIGTDILLAAGTLDPVAPVEATAAIHEELPNSRLVVFEATHTLAGPEAARDARNRIIELFLRHGGGSEELERYLGSDEAERSGLVAVR